MKVIGLCGGSGSGKGTVCSIFEELGIESIDTDKLYHTIISEDSGCTNELVAAFGREIYANPGIDRSALRTVAFSSPENLRRLNEITHKHILSGVRSIIKSSKNPLGIIIDAPLLFESGFDKECDTTVAVIADNSIRVDRIVIRDNISEDYAKARISSQISNDELVQRCDYTIENNSTIDELRENVVQLYKKMFNN